jgi:hypothetical protein
MDNISYYTITICPWLSKAHGHLIMENSFSPSPRVPHVLTVPTLFKSPHSKTLLRPKAISWVWAPVKSERKFHTSKIQWHIVNTTIAKGRNWRITRMDRPKQDWHPVWQILNPAVPCVAAGACVVMVWAPWPCYLQSTVLAWPHHPLQLSTFLASQILWDFLCSFSFTFTASCLILSVTA